MWVDILKNKPDAFDTFNRLKNPHESEEEVKLKCLRIDHSGEFINEECSKWCE